MAQWEHSGLDPDPDLHPTTEGEPALHRAARYGDAEAIRRLVAKGHDVNALCDIAPESMLLAPMATPRRLAFFISHDFCVRDRTSAAKYPTSQKTNVFASSPRQIGCVGSSAGSPAHE